MYAAEAVQLLSCMRRTGTASSVPHGNENWIFKTSDPLCLLGEWSRRSPTRHSAVSTAAYYNNAAAREIVRVKGERHLSGSYRLVTNDVYRTRFLSAPLPIGASIWYHFFDGSWWLGKIKQPSNVLGRYVVRFLDNPGPALIDLPETAYNTALHAPRGSWCLHTHGRTNPLQGVLHG